MLQVALNGLKTKHDAETNRVRDNRTCSFVYLSCGMTWPRGYSFSRFAYPVIRDREQKRRFSFCVLAVRLHGFRG